MYYILFKNISKITLDNFIDTDIPCFKNSIWYHIFIYRRYLYLLCVKGNRLYNIICVVLI